MLELKNIYLQAGNFELKDITFRVERGEYLTILGPSGAGKSTLLELIAGFRKPLRGRIFFNGNDITDLPPEKRGFAVVYQDYLLFPHLTVFENIAFGLKKLIKEKPALRREVLKIAKELGVEHLLDKKTDLLSGGERQRVAIARALVVKPKLLLMDEPFSALDGLTKERLRKLVKETVKKHNTTVVQITHDPLDALELSDRVILLKEGQILENLPTRWFFNCPKTRFAEEFVQTNTLEGIVGEISPEGVLVKVDGTPLRIKNFREQLRKGQKVKVCFRPEAVSLKKGENTLKVSVKEVSEKGFFYEVVFSFKGKALKALLPPSEAEILKPEKEIEISIPSEELFVSPL